MTSLFSVVDPWSMLSSALCRVTRPAFFAALLAFSLLSFRGQAQALPAATAPEPYSGFALPNIGGTLQYAISASESIIYGYDGQSGSGTQAATNFAGDLAYLSKSDKRPFSAIYSGGFLVGDSAEPSYPFQNLALSQVFKGRVLTFIVADSINYLPQTPVGGLSGIPGVGDIGITPVSVGGPADLGILTQYSTRVSNAASGTLSRQLTGKTSLQGTGGYSILRFVGSSVGLDNNQVSGSGGLDRRINARSSINAAYTYSSSVFLHSSFSFVTQGIAVGYNRQITRQLSLSLSAGPQRVSSSNDTLRSSSTNVSADAGFAYTARVLRYNLHYSRGVSNGDGVVVGSRSDSVNLGVNRRFGRFWSASGNLGYNHSTSLASLILPSFSNNASVASIQGSRGIGRSLSLFLQYTLQRQSVTGTAAGSNAFNGLSQVLGFGVTYSPRPFLSRR